MGIEQNVMDRKHASSLADVAIDLIRDEYKKLSTNGKVLFQQLMHDRMAKNLKLPCSEKPKQEPEKKPIPAPQSSKEWEEAIEELQNLIDDCECIPERGEEFAESVAAGARDMIGVIEERKHVTAKQWTAIENWQGGVSKWLS